MSTPTHIPNRHEALKHLRLLDTTTEHFTFQAFDDNDKRKAPSLTAIFHGRLEDNWNAMVRLNMRGAGIYITVNATDLEGRKTTNMQGDRAVWGDFDKQPTKQFPLEPTFWTRTSPAKGHCYWCYEGGLSPDEHLAVEARIVADYGADPKAMDFTRVLRLAGFYHRKGEPHLVTVDERSTGKRYSKAEILAALPPLSKQKKMAEPIPEVIVEGTRDTTLVSVAGTMRKRGLPVSSIEAALHDLNQTTCSPPLPDKQVEKIAKSVGKYQPGSLSGSDTAAIDRLALLPPIEYERVRMEEAKKLGIKRVRVLDAQVAARRAELEAENTDDPMRAIEPWHEPVDGQDLVIDLAVAFRRHCILPEHADIALALWTLHAHAHDAWSVSPYLAVQSPEKGCGKSTLLDVLSLVVPKPRLSSSMTPAVMFRVIDQHTPTLLVDEADSLSKLDPEKVAIINSMHRRSSAYVERCVGDNHVPTRFKTWAPLALAGIGELPGTIQDRSIVVGLKRMLPGEKIERLRMDKPTGFDVLRRKAARWVADHFEALKAADPPLPVALFNRDGDKWRPLIAIADAIGGPWPEIARQAAVQITAGVQARATPSNYTRLLQDCRRVAAAQTGGTIAPKDLLLGLLNLTDADWSTLDRGRPISDKYMARALKHYGIVSDKSKARYYSWADFEDAWRRYLPPETDDVEPPETSAAQEAAIAADFGDVAAL